jgi:hypothetical protein
MRTTSLLCAFALVACSTEDQAELEAAATVDDLPQAGTIGTPIDGFAIYDTWIDNGNQCGDASLRSGLQTVRDYLKPFAIVGSTYVQCGGYHSVGQALDVFIYGHAAKQRFADWLVANNAEMARRLGLTQIIWNHRMWRSYTSSGGSQNQWSSYNGSNPHTDHIHISFAEAGARGETSFFRDVIGGAPASTGYAFQANTGELWIDGAPSGLGMMHGTSPARAGGHVAFQANTGELWLDGAPRGLGLAAGSSPAITANGVVAFQANTGELWVGFAPTGLGMAAGTSPSIADSGVVAFQANTTELWVNNAPTGLGMMPGTSPDVATLASGRTVAAFQSNTGELWVDSAPTGLGMAAGTSPSIAAYGGGYRYAFQANTGELWVDGAPTGLGMRGGTSPTVSPSGAVMFQANTGELWSLAGPTGLGMAANTSPAN